MGLAKLPKLKRLYLYDNNIPTATMAIFLNKLSKNCLIEY